LPVRAATAAAAAIGKNARSLEPNIRQCPEVVANFAILLGERFLTFLVGLLLLAEYLVLGHVGVM
jgi:hypothetical protein